MYVPFISSTQHVYYLGSASSHGLALDTEIIFICQAIDSKFHDRKSQTF